MFTTPDLEELRRSIAEATSPETADEILFRLGRNIGEREGRRLLATEPDERRALQQGLEHLEGLGLGRVHLEEYTHAAGERSCHLVGRVLDPGRQEGGGGPSRVEEGLRCGLTVGYLTGLAAVITGLDVVCSPFHCAQDCQNAGCRFEVRPAHAWERRPDGPLATAGSARFFLGTLGSALGERDISLADVVESSGDAILILDSEDVIRFWNRGAERMFGYSRDEAVGRRFDFLVPRDLLVEGEIERIRARTIAEGGIANMITRRLRRSGEEFTASLTRTPLHDSRGHVVGSAAFLRDVSEQLRTQQQLEHARSLATIGELAAMVAHEIKNPLAGIYAGVQLLGRSLDEDDERGAVISEITREIRRLDATTHDLLRLTRSAPAHRVRTNLAEYMRELVASLERQPEVVPHTLVLDCPTDLIASIDVGMTTQILQNLVLNAAQAMAEVPGTIRLRAGTAEGTPFVSVSDTGPGIAADQVAQIFEPFFTTKSRGTGLGLAVARKDAEAQGGSIDVENLPEGGACFTVRLSGPPS